MTSKTSHATFFVVHSITHVFLYLIPRAVHHLLVRWPITCGQWLLGLPRTYCSRREREVRVIAHPRRTEARDAFGLTPGEVGSDVVWQYDGPLYSGHIHTILGSHRPCRAVAYTRETVTAVDGNPLCLDFYGHQEAAGTGESSGMILVLPGLMSSSEAPYIRSFVRRMAAAGYHVCVANSRGVKGTTLERPRTFSALWTADIRQIIECHFQPEQVMSRLRATTAKPLFLVGFSLGGIVMCHYISEESQRLRQASLDADGGVTTCHHAVAAAISITAPWDMIVSSRKMECWSSWLLYRLPLLSGLLDYYTRNREMIEAIPELQERKEQLFGRGGAICHLRSVQDFDDHITAPQFGFDSANAYYIAGCCAPSLSKALLPLLCLGTRDDPITGLSMSHAGWRTLVDANEHVVYLELPVGGHIGFLGSPLHEATGRANEMERIVANALDAFRTARPTAAP